MSLEPSPGQPEEEETCTDTCPAPTLKHKEKKEDKSLQLKKVFNELAEELKCALCLELFDKPVVLTCLHTFCAPCLREIVIESIVVCPLCRSRHELGNKGIEGLKINYHLLNIAEKMRTASLKRCDECQMGPVAEYCKQCKAYLCGSCGTKIHALRLMRVHTRRPLDPSDSLMMDELDIDLDEFRSYSSGSDRSSPAPSPSPSPVPSPVPSPSPSPHLRTENTTTSVQPDDIIVDFVVRRDKCLENLRHWMSNLWFAPTDFRSTYHIRQVKPLLVPFWLFELETQSSYTASIAISLGVNASSMTKDTHWTSIAGESPGRFRVAVSACDNIENSLLSKIGPWELDDIRPPAPPSDLSSSSDEGDSRILGGIPRSQILGITVDSPTAYQKGGEGENVESKVMHLAADQVQRVVRDRAGAMNAVRNVRLRSVVTRVAAQRVFMPVWMIKYTYGGQNYVVVVNGQNGNIYGDRPYSVGKVASLSITGIGAIVGIFAKTKI
eukprot:Phypoly_transcript_05045.p1 GENE.Phypoly_transcript_05045~~Phypoly_transcript_05045.p1  ORF type:complete len:496 (+),score=63.42 Phypoly_transcript_05045:153-1640(+)